MQDRVGAKIKTLKKQNKKHVDYQQTCLMTRKLMTLHVEALQRQIQ